MKTTAWIHALALVAALAGCGEADGDVTLTNRSAALVTGSFTFSLPLLHRSSPAEYAVAAASTLKINPNVVIQSGSLRVQAFNAGSGLTTVDVAAKLGTVVSQGAVELRDRVEVTGTVESAGNVTTGANVTVTGGIIKQTPIGALDNVTFGADFSGSLPADKVVSSGSQTLNGGHFRALQVMGGATVVLNPGTYYFTKLTFESNSKLSLGSGTGPVVVYVADTVIYRGTTLGTDAEKRLLVAVAGTTPIFIETPFRGTLVAPLAPVSVGQSGVTHNGAFFGLSVDVAPGVTIKHAPFDWVSFLPKRTVNWKDAPVTLVGTLGADGAVTDGVANPPAAVPFTIPGAIKVKAGNAGNGTTTLTFTNGSGTNVTCTYKGAAPSPPPCPRRRWSTGPGASATSWSRAATASPPAPQPPAATSSSTSCRGTRWVSASSSTASLVADARRPSTTRSIRSPPPRPRRRSPGPPPRRSPRPTRPVTPASVTPGSTSRTRSRSAA